MPAHPHLLVFQNFVSSRDHMTEVRARRVVEADKYLSSHHSGTVSEWFAKRSPKDLGPEALDRFLSRFFEAYSHGLLVPWLKKIDADAATRKAASAS